MSTLSLCNFVVALDSEARAIIQFYQLKRRQDIASHVVYSCRQQSIFCIVSGIGMQASQSAVDFLAGWQLATIQAQNQHLHHSQTSVLNNYKESTRWINVGIAAHGHQSLGDIFRINKVQSQSLSFSQIPQSISQKEIHLKPDLASTYYPMNTLKAAKLKSKALLSCYHVVKDYRAINEDHELSDYLYDMEGAGFVRAAKRYGSMELIQLIKIVSDNVDSPVNQSSNQNNDFGAGANSPKKQWAQLAQALVAQHIALIDQYVQQLYHSVNHASGFEGSAFNEQIEAEKNKLMQRYQFTLSQSLMLQNILQSLYARFNGPRELFDDYISGLLCDIDGNHGNKAKQVMTSLENEIKQLKWIL